MKPGSLKPLSRTLLLGRMSPGPAPRGQLPGELRRMHPQSDGAWEGGWEGAYQGPTLAMQKVGHHHSR